MNQIHVNGSMINYYFICKTKLWLFAHNIEMENESDNVKLGRQLHETAYKRDNEQLIDNLISVDFIRKKGCTYEIHEIKKTDKMELAHKYQLLFYMYYLKTKKDFKDVVGILNYPTLRKTKKINLTKENEEELKKILENISKIVCNVMPKAKKTKICYKCAYYEFCFI